MRPCAASYDGPSRRKQLLLKVRLKTANEGNGIEERQQKGSRHQRRYIDICSNGTYRGKEGGRGEAFVHSATAYPTMHGGRGARDTSRGYICENKTLTRRLQQRNGRRVNGVRAAFSCRWAAGTCRKSLFAEFSRCQSRRPTRSCRIHSRGHGVYALFNSHSNMHCRSLTHLTRRHVFHNN